MKIILNKKLLQSAIQFSFACFTATAAITLIVSPNIVQGAIDGYDDCDGYDCQAPPIDEEKPRPPITEEEKKVVEEQESEQEAVSEAVLRQTISTTVRTTTSHVKALSGGKNRFSIANADYANYKNSGLNAGSSISGMAAWLTLPYSNYKDNAFTNKGSRFDGHTMNYLAGMDYVVNAQTAVGASIGYEDTNISFNNGSSTDTDGWFGTLYGAYNFSEATAYLIAGYGSGKADPSGAESYDSNSNFITAGAMKDFELSKNLFLNLDTSYTYAESESDDYSKNGLIISPDGAIISQINVNAELANATNWGEFYGLAETKFDLYNDDDDLYDNGDFGMNLGLGVRFNASQAITGDINVKSLVVGKDQENYTITASFRYQF